MTFFELCEKRVSLISGHPILPINCSPPWASPPFLHSSLCSAVVASHRARDDRTASEQAQSIPTRLVPHCSPSHRCMPNRSLSQRATARHLWLGHNLEERRRSARHVNGGGEQEERWLTGKGARASSPVPKVQDWSRRCSLRSPPIFPGDNGMKILARDEDDHDIAARHLPITPLAQRARRQFGPRKRLRQRPCGSCSPLQHPS